MTSDVADAIARLEASIALDSRLRTLEQAVAALNATVTAASRPAQWPAVLSAIVGVGGVLLAFTTVIGK